MAIIQSFTQSNLRLPYLIVLVLGVICLTASVQAETSQNDFSCSNVNQIAQTECEALAALYESTDGVNWEHNSGWIVNNRPCTWYGVTCEGSHVTELRLFGTVDNHFGLTGAIPAEIGNLSSLELLAFSYNDLTSVPEQLWTLQHLRLLLLGGNQLDTLSASVGNLANLSELYLHRNRLRTLPTQIGELSNLTKLSLYGNQLERLPPTIGNLGNLTGLYLHENELIELPESIRSLVNLTQLSLGDNQLRTLPVAIGSLSRLSVLWLHKNQLTTLPESIGNLKNLISLMLNSNQLTTLPEGVGELSNLIHLGLSDNRLSTLSRSIGNLTNLSELHLRSNRLRTLPKEIGQLAKLKKIILFSNQLSTLPEEICDLAMLRELYLHDNQLVTLPSCMSKSTDLAILEVGYNCMVNPTPTLVEWLNAKDPDWLEQQDACGPTSTGGIVDLYESNNTCDQAKAISTDGMAQVHSFDPPEDVDWGFFEVAAGTRYRVELIVPDGSPAHVQPKLYRGCNSVLDDIVWSGAFGPHARRIFTAPDDGPLYLEVANQKDGIYGNQAIYQISAQPLAAAPDSQALIMVAGRLDEKDDAVQQKIHNVTNRAYKLFLQNGYDKEDVFYLATDSTISGYDGPALLEQIEFAITEWAMDRLGQQGVLTLYIVDHGGNDHLYIDGVSEQTLRPDMLDRWLTTLETAKPGLQVNVIIEASQSGSFIEGGSTISKLGRIVVTASDSARNAYLSENGAYFSEFFLTALWQGRSFYDSFQEARKEVKRLIPFQEPQLDANGDGIHNDTADRFIASRHSFTHANIDYWPPHIAQVTATFDLGSGSVSIEADVQGNDDINRVWAFIYPPSHVHEVKNIGQLVQDDLPSVGLVLDSDTKHFTGESLFDEIGTYRIVIHAENDQGLLARPKIVEFSVMPHVYLPTIMQQGTSK